MTLAIAVASLGVSGRLAGRYGRERVLVVGLVLFVAGMLSMAALPDHGSFALHVAPGFVVMGIGFGLAMPQVTALAMDAAPQRDAGAASGFVTPPSRPVARSGWRWWRSSPRPGPRGRVPGRRRGAGAGHPGGGVPHRTAAWRRRPDAGPRPSGRTGTPTLERC